MAHATPQQQQAFARHQRFGPVAAQRQQRDLASRTPALRAASNRGAPPIAATQRAGAFHGNNVTAAHGARATTDVRATRPAPTSNQPSALRSAGFAPRAQATGDVGRANTPRGNRAERGNAAMPGRNAHRGNDYRAESAGMPIRYQPAGNSYRQPMHAPRAEPAPRAIPTYRAAAPHAAPRAQRAPAAGHEGRGHGRDDRR